MLLRAPDPPFFPYTTLFRCSTHGRCVGGRGARGRGARRARRRRARRFGGARDPKPRAGARHERRSEEHTSELQSRFDLVCRLLLEKKKNISRMLMGFGLVLR